MDWLTREDGTLCLDGEDIQIRRGCYTNNIRGMTAVHYGARIVYCGERAVFGTQDLQEAKERAESLAKERECYE